MSSLKQGSYLPSLCPSSQHTMGLLNMGWMRGWVNMRQTWVDGTSEGMTAQDPRCQTLSPPRSWEAPGWPGQNQWQISTSLSQHTRSSQMRGSASSWEETLFSPCWWDGDGLESTPAPSLRCNVALSYPFKDEETEAPAQGQIASKLYYFLFSHVPDQLP